VYLRFSESLLGLAFDPPGSPMTPRDHLPYSVIISLRPGKGHPTTRQYVNISSAETPIRLAIAVSVC
jgi:hypothetical protein